MAKTRTLAVCMLGLIATACGCGDAGWGFGFKQSAAAPPQAVPAPIDLLLPKTIRIHPFTQTRVFDEAGGIKGVDVRIEAVDAYGDATKAFGDFRFEMYDFVTNSLDPKGKRIATWNESLLEPKRNLLHWDKITRTYEFKLQWDRPIPVGKRYVLVAVFSSPFTRRIIDERVFVSGQHE